MSTTGRRCNTPCPPPCHAPMCHPPPCPPVSSPLKDCPPPNSSWQPKDCCWLKRWECTWEECTDVPPNKTNEINVCAHYKKWTAKYYRIEVPSQVCLIGEELDSDLFSSLDCPQTLPPTTTE